MFDHKFTGFTHTVVSTSYTTVAAVQAMFFEMRRSPVYLLECNF